jgi:hypothetical protein
MKTYPDIGIRIPKLYLPRKGTDLTKWSVIACDQFTSQPEYWHIVETLVGDAPSTYNMVLPEVFLEKPGVEGRVKLIQDKMLEYLENGYISEYEGLIYIERTTSGKTRHGIMLCLDLEHYDFSKGSTSLIRATEGTIIERLPPRMKIRRGAVLEFPHILVLIDDPEHTVFGSLEKARSDMVRLYDFDLMLGSGHLTGYAVTPSLEDHVVAALGALAQPSSFSARYKLPGNDPVMLFAMGDGNHSLATAKAVWEEMKPEVGMDHPARYALVEIENVHDEGLQFEPIHRVLFGLTRDIYAALSTFFGSNFHYTPVANKNMMIQWIDKAQGTRQVIGVVGGGKSFGVMEIDHPSTNLAVGSLQAFLDRFLNEGGAEKIDYVHGKDVVCDLGIQPGNIGFYLPGMNKSDLFKTVILDGVLPRKTFSMGEAKEKRFYMEGRKIV